MSDDIKRRALALYTPPFRYERGYIFDASGFTVADDHIGTDSGVSLRVRGWGRLIGGGVEGLKLPHDEAAQLQDAVGEILAEALTQYWEREAPR